MVRVHLVERCRVYPQPCKGSGNDVIRARAILHYARLRYQYIPKLMDGKCLHIVVCAAGPAKYFQKLATLAENHQWRVQVSFTARAEQYFSLLAPHGHDRSIQPDAAIFAPATFNTINAMARGILPDPFGWASNFSQTVPTVILPFVNKSLGSRRPFITSLSILRNHGVHVLYGQKGLEPHEAGAGGVKLDQFPWAAALEVIEKWSDQNPQSDPFELISPPKHIRPSQSMLYVVVFEEIDVIDIVSKAQHEGWLVRVICSPTVSAQLDRSWLEKQTGIPVQFTHQTPRSSTIYPKADAFLIVAPGGVIRKLASGISDIYALDVVNENLHIVPTVIVTDVSHILLLKEEIRELGEEGVIVYSKDMKDLWPELWRRLKP